MRYLYATLVLYGMLVYLGLCTSANNVEILKPKPRRVKSKVHEGFIAQAQQPHDIAFYGDSITIRFLESPIWKKTYLPLNASNFGISGDRIEELWWRIRNGELESSNPPKVMVVLIGTNNLWNTSNEVIVNTINGLLTDMHQIAPSSRVILLGIFSRGATADDPARARVTAINKMLSSFENKVWLYYLDFSDKFIESDGSITEEMMPDFLHLGAKGYAIWEREMNPLLTQLLALLPLPIQPGHVGLNRTSDEMETAREVKGEQQGVKHTKISSRGKGRKKGSRKGGK